MMCYKGIQCDGEIIKDGKYVRVSDCCAHFGYSLRTPIGGELGGMCHRCVGKSKVSIM